MAKVVINIIQGSVVTQTVLSGLTIYPRLQISSSEYVPKIIFKNWLAVDKVIAKIIRLTFLAHPIHCCQKTIPFLLQ